MACLPSCSLDSRSSLLHLISTRRGSYFPSWGHDIANLHPPRVLLVLKPIPDPLTSSRPANYIRVLRGTGGEGRGGVLSATSRYLAETLICEPTAGRCLTLLQNVTEVIHQDVVQKEAQKLSAQKRQMLFFCRDFDRVGSSFGGRSQNSWLYFFPTTAETQSVRGSGIMPQIPHR